MKQALIVLSAVPFEIRNNETDEIENEGCTVRYILSDDLLPCEETGKRQSKGRPPAKITLPPEQFKDFIVAPGLYEVTLNTRVDSQGKASLVPSDFKFLSRLSVSRVGPNGKTVAPAPKPVAPK